MEGKTETRIFRRKMFINDPDPKFAYVPREAREKERWAIRADGREVTFEDGSENGWTKVPENEIVPYSVSRDWTEPIDQEVK